MLNVSSFFMKQPEVDYATIQDGTSIFTTVKTGTTTTRYIAVQVFLHSEDIDNASLAKSIGQIIVSNHASALSKNVIQVTLIYGYDIGIWSFWNNFNHEFSPNELQE